jgi:putative heme-binding domain-containing protein
LFDRAELEHVFTCEPVHNLVQHLVVRSDGTSFSAQRPESDGDTDFLASEDQWFRPVMARMGPDGALWVVDMYRYMIEHPDWLPPEGRKELEPFYRQGETRGRIYRIVPKGRKRPADAAGALRLDKLPVDELVAALENPNGWRRDKAQQLLIWRGDKSAVVPLEKLLTGSTRPWARLHALSTLDGLGSLRPAVVQQALHDPHPAVRRQALRVAENLPYHATQERREGRGENSPKDSRIEPLNPTQDRAGASPSPLKGERAGVRGENVLQHNYFDGTPARTRLTEVDGEGPQSLIQAAAQLVTDPDAKVKLQLACTLGEWSDTRAGDALARLAVENSKDPYITAAVLSSALPHVDRLVKAVVHHGGTALDDLGDPLLKLSLALNRRELVADLLGPILTPRDGEFTQVQMNAFRHFLDLLARQKTSLNQLLAGAEDSLAHQLRQRSGMLAAARRTVSNPARPEPDRAAAAGLLGREPAQISADVDLLVSLLQPSTSGEVQKAAVKALAWTARADIPQLLLQNWPAQPPEIRAVILDELLGRESWALELLAQIQRGQVAPVDLDAARQGRLLKHSSESVRNLAGNVFAATSNPDRQRVIESFRPALALTGDTGRGKAAFARICSTCHLLDGVGREIGPNLISVKAHPPEKLLTSILDPSREVEPRYLAYDCTLTTDEELYGLIMSETGNGIVLKLGDGTTRNVLRSEIKSLRGTKISLMPDGLEAGLTHQDLADLLRYLRAQPGVD